MLILIDHDDSKEEERAQGTQGDQKCAAKTEKCERLSEFVEWNLVSLEASRRSSSPAAKTWRKRER